jgi:hypothetical protein
MVLPRIRCVAKDIPQIELYPLTYESILDTPRIAGKHQHEMDVLLFAGVMGYFLAASAVQPTIPWHYIDRAIEGLPFAFIAARDFLKKDIRVATDLFTKTEIDDTLKDMDFNIGAIYTLEFNPMEYDKLLDFHLSLHKEGRVAFSMTSFSMVYTTLRSMDIPVFLVLPPTQMIRRTLNHLLQVSRVSRDDNFKLVVGLISPENLPSSVNLYENTLRSVSNSIFACAQKKGFLVFTRNAALFQCIQTYDQFYAETNEFRKTPFVDEVLKANPNVRLRIGYGVASNVKSAEIYAEKALDMSTIKENYLFDGEKGWLLGNKGPIFTVTDSDPALRLYSQRMGITVATFSRYLRVFRLLESQFSAENVAKALGLQAKSVRKILALFLKEGLIALGNYRAPLAKGRPEALYTLSHKIHSLLDHSVNDGR